MRRLTAGVLAVACLAGVPGYEWRGLNSLNLPGTTGSGDGSYTIQFGGCTKQTQNCLATPPGWNYAVRMYRPRKGILDGTWRLPQAVPAN